MTDELDLLKRDWQKKELNLPKLSYEDIHKMIWKKSSSIVKWILIISILEFALPHLLYLVPSLNEDLEFWKKLGVYHYLQGITIISYVVAIYFIFQFYKRFKEISALDDAKSLMRKIIKTRRTVKHYVIYSLSMCILIFIVFGVGVLLNEDVVYALSEINPKAENASPQQLKTALLMGIGIFGTLTVLLLGGVYFLLYGLLLRKLNKNYKELKQLEI